jgi:hypothetical protein
MTDAGTDALTQFSNYLSALFEPTDLVEVRLLPGGRKLFAVARDWPGKFPELVFANIEGGQDVYAGVNPRFREGGTEQDVACARCLFADWDDVEPDDACKLIADRKLPVPTLTVHSGHGVHAYWKLVEPVTDLGLWRRAMERLTVRAGSDAKIKDPPRIMRLPGLLNLPDERKGEGAAVAVTIIGSNLEAVYRVAEVAGEDKGEAARSAPAVAVASLPSNSVDRYARLSRATMQFIVAGAADGERQTRCFHAACDMFGNGFSLSEIEAKLIPAAIACGCAEHKARQAVRSADSKPRQPAVPLGAAENDEIVTALMLKQRSNGKAVGPVKEPAEVRPPRPVENGRIQISNVIDTTYRDGNGEDVVARYHVPLPEIHRAINEATGGWPRQAGGMLFVVRETEHSLPDARGVQWILDVDDLFAWIGRDNDVRWAGGDALHPVSKRKLNPPTKRELFAYLKDNAMPAYRAVELLPHHPPIDGLYYVPCELPPVPLPDGSARTPLGELINRFNPETPEDRLLMLAALLTPGWGGPPGARPAFVFTSEHGRGVGKTATATVLAEIWGGATTIGMREDWDKVRGRLLGESSLAQRIVIIDNIKGRLHGSDIEGLITASEIDGWKPYHGQASRPNLLTWFFSSNSPSLSRDLADRSIVIKIGPKQHEFNFVDWARRWVKEHRAAIVSELLEILRGEPLCGIERENRDRWGSWQDAILTRFDDGNELARLCIGRRPAVDADLEEAEEIAQAVLELVASQYKDHEYRIIRITRDQLQRKLVAASVIDKTMHPRAVTTMVKDKVNTGSLTFLNYKAAKESGVSDRFWFYSGPKIKGGEDADSLLDP